MKYTPKYLSILGLAMVLTPCLQLHAEPAKKAAPQVETAGADLDASFAAISNTIRTARKQASVAVSERNKALNELSASRKQQEETAQHLEQARKQQEETAKLLAETRQQLATSKTAQEKSKKEAEMLAQQLKVGDEAYTKLVALRTQMQESLKNLAGIDDTISKFRAELASPTSVGKLQTEIVSLKSNGDDLGKQLAANKSQLEKERQQREQISKSAEATRKQLETAKKESSEIEKNYQKTIARASELEKAQVVTLTALKHAKNDVVEARESAEKIKKCSSESTAALAQANKEISNLKQARKAAEDKAASASAKLESARKNGELLESALKTSESKVGELETQMKKVSKNLSGQAEEKLEGDS